VNFTFSVPKRGTGILVFHEYQRKELDFAGLIEKGEPASNINLRSGCVSELARSKT